MCDTDPQSESRYALLFYVPRDENFSAVKTVNFGAKALYSALHALVPTLEGLLIEEDFPHFTAIDTLFDQGIKIPPNSDKKGLLKSVLPRLVKAASDVDDVLQYEPPETMDSKQYIKQHKLIILVLICCSYMLLIILCMRVMTQLVCMFS